MRHLFLFLILCYLSFTSSGQQILKGQIRDSVLNKGLEEASIIAIKKNDSTLHSFVRSQTDGSFQLMIRDTGHYKILYTHPNYADFTEDVLMDSLQSQIAPRTIYLSSRLRMLKEVIISGKGSMRIKGDTTVYIADSFKVSEGANVEELLKLLPGIEVNKDGSIKAQGQTVQRVLVDGDEFFGDDPTLATQNLESKIVERVEVFDKKSDQAELTGFDDGEKSKTINLKLKKGMNKGLFGKLEAGANITGRTNNKVMMNQFEDKRKLAGFGVIGSTYDVNLNWNDASKYGADDLEIDDEGNMYRYGYDDASDGGSSMEGLPAHRQVSLSYSNKLYNDKLKVNASASYKNKNVVRKNYAATTTLYAEDTVQNTNSEDIFAGRSQPAASVKLEWKPDTSITIRSGVSYTQDALDKTALSFSVNKVNGNDTTSSSERNSVATSSKHNLKADITLMKKLRKKGRSVSLSEAFTFAAQQGQNYVKANNNFESTMQHQDQISDMQSSAASTNTKVVYTEPLFREKVLLEANYSFNYKSGSQNFGTFAKDSLQDEYNNRIDSLSNHFVTDLYAHRGGLRFRLQQKKYNLSLGMDVANAHYIQKNLSGNLNYDYTRLNIFPVLGLTYKFTSNSSLSVNYSGSTAQPTLFQQQPLTNNSNPLNIIKGNPNLIQEYNQSININFWDYKMLTERAVWIGGYLANTIQNISSAYVYDAAYGRNVSSYANLNGLFNGSFWSGVRRRLNRKLSGGLDFDFSISRNPYLQQSIKLFQQSNQFSFNPNCSYYIENRFSASIDLNVGRAYNKVGDGSWNAYWKADPTLELKYSPFKKWRIQTDLNLDYQQKAPPFNADFKRLYWNASTAYDLNKRRTWSATFSIKDILNQNNGYNRSFYGNTISEVNNLTIRRNWLAGFVWKFNKSKIEKKEEDDEFFNH